MARGKLAQWISPEGLARLEEWAASRTDEEMIAGMGVAASTFYRWRAQHDEIENAITAGRTGALAQQNIRAVEASLLERSLGGTHVVAKAVKLKEVEYDERGRRVREVERVQMAEETVYVPADTAAIRFFLTNRAPEKWKNKTELAADPETREGVEEFLRSLTDGGREF